MISFAILRDGYAVQMGSYSILIFRAHYKRNENRIHIKIPSSTFTYPNIILQTLIRFPIQNIEFLQLTFIVGQFSKIKSITRQDIICTILFL